MDMLFCTVLRQTQDSLRQATGFVESLPRSIGMDADATAAFGYHLPTAEQLSLVVKAETPRLADIERLSAYLNRVARNAAFERTRSRKRKDAITFTLDEQYDPGAPAEQTWRRAIS